MDRMKGKSGQQIRGVVIAIVSVGLPGDFALRTFCRLETKLAQYVDDITLLNGFGQ